MDSVYNEQSISFSKTKMCFFPENIFCVSESVSIFFFFFNAVP